MARAEKPPEINIPALRRREVRRRNLMAAGSGTPWEDRGQLGLLTAFLHTCVMTIRQPVRLVHKIRRPETDRDTRAFVLGCGVVWGASLVVHGLLMLWQASRQERTEIHWTGAGMQLGLQMLLAPMVLLMLLKLHTRLFNTLAATELKSHAPPVLTFNVFGYCLGGSLLALAPLIGPPLAVVWIYAVMVLVSIRRLQVGRLSAIIGVALSMAVVLAVAAGIYFGGELAWRLLVGSPVETWPAPAAPRRGF